MFAVSLFDPSWFTIHTLRTHDWKDQPMKWSTHLLNKVWFQFFLINFNSFFEKNSTLPFKVLDNETLFLSCHILFFVVSTFIIAKISNPWICISTWRKIQFFFFFSNNDARKSEHSVGWDYSVFIDSFLTLLRRLILLVKLFIFM